MIKETGDQVSPVGDDSSAVKGDSQKSVESTDWISWLKFVAICAVITIHTAGLTALVDGVRNIDTRAGYVAIVLDAVSIFSVPIFVMLTGALTLNPKKYIDASDFLKKRAIRLLPAIIVWSVFYYWFNGLIRGIEMTPAEALGYSLSGKLSTGLYFLWIVLGLALVAPVLIPWIANSKRKEILIGGAVAALIPILTVSLTFIPNSPAAFYQTAWSWWLPYLGMFILGFGLRGIVVSGVTLFFLILFLLAQAALQAWIWYNVGMPQWLAELSPTSTYSLLVLLYSLTIFVVVQSLIQPSGLLSPFTRGKLATWGRTLGDSTLGVFVLHIAVLFLMLKYVPVIGGDRATASVSILLLRVLIVIVITYAIVIVLRKVPIIRKVL